MKALRLLSQLCLVALLPAAGASAHADLLSTIKQKGEITVATEARYAPFEMLQDGKIVGYGKDILDEVMKALPGVKLKQVDVPFQGILPGLSAGKFDLVATSLTITQARAKNYAFTYPIATATVTVLKRKGDERIQRAEDMKGMVVGSQAGAPQVAVLRDFEKDVLKPKGQALKDVKEFMDYNEAYAALASRRVDAVVQSLPNLAPLIKERPGVFEIIQPPFGPASYYAWAGRKDDDSASLVKLFSEEIGRLNQSGKLAELQMKWFGFAMPVPHDRVPAPIN
ncbi:transporter substrate-binding domain-containing protein [Comamonas aquatica]|uniref:transporter substrate-binding domain-containing protein n=1 Tax=Comamonas aquatica TaxID=225991 RepID=UPI002448416E|nr:transporter substrate-binding domain-containing protein [Comamonas aquatica]MDH0373427.1 transporter substrate-binding domain-containing protein [Comamonas aquatica]